MSDRPPDWSEHPDYQDWPDYEGETDSGLGNGRGRAEAPGRPRQRPDAAEPGQGGPRRGQQSEWRGPVGPGWPAPGGQPAAERRDPGGQPGWQDAGDRSEPPWRAGQPPSDEPRWRDPRDRSGPGRDEAPDEPEWRDAATWGTDPRGVPPPPGGWQDPPTQPGEPGPGGKHDSGRVIPGRAQRNSGRITGRLTRRTQRGGRQASRRDLADGTQAPPPRPEAEAPGPPARPAWSPEQPDAGRSWPPEGHGQAPPAGRRPTPPPAWAGGEQAPPPAPPRGPAGGGAPPPAGAQRPVPPQAWARGEPSDPGRFAGPAGAPRPRHGSPPAPGSGDDQPRRYGEAPAGPGFAGYGGPPAAERRDDLAGRPRRAGYDAEDGVQPEGLVAGEPGAPGWDGPAALPRPSRGRPRHGAHGRTRARRLPGLPKPSLPKPSLPTVRRARIPQASLALAGIAILVAGGLAGLMNVLPKASAPVAADAGAPYSARWVCPLLPSSLGTVVTDNLGQRAAAMRVGVNALRSQGVAGPGGQPFPDLAAGASRQVRAQSGPNGGFVQVEAFGAPIAATSADQPTCVPGPATRWWLSGLTVTNETKVTMVIANPETADATVNITPHVSEGSLHPEGLQNVFVKAGTTVRKDLSVPQVQGLPFTAEVVASQGRVVVGTRMDSRIGERQESLIVPAQQTERSSWLFSGGLAGDARQVELLVTNPNPKALSLVVEGVNDQGRFKVPGFDLPISDGSSNEAIVPVQFGKTGAFSLRVRSKDGSRFVAAMRFGSGASPVNASYLDLGGSGLDARWMAPVAPTSGRVVLANTAATPVRATLSGLARSDGGASTQAGPAGKGSAVTIQPGQVRIATVPKGVRSLLLVADGPGLVVAPVGEGQLVPGSQVGGVPLAGAVTPGPAAAP